MNYKFTNNVPNKDKLLDNVLINTTNNLTSPEKEVGSTYVSEDSDSVEVEMTKNKEGNYFLWTGSTNKETIDEESNEVIPKVTLSPATQLYMSGMTVVGLFILYRLMMRYK